MSDLRGPNHPLRAAIEVVLGNNPSSEDIERFHLLVHDVDNPDVHWNEWARHVLAEAAEAYDLTYGSEPECYWERAYWRVVPLLAALVHSDKQ